MKNTVELLLLVALACMVHPGCDQIATVGIVAGEAGSLHDASGDRGDARDGTVEAAVDAGGPGPSDASTDDSSAICRSPEIAGCNPVTNTGCSAAVEQRCAPNLAAASLEGYCTFMGPIPDGGLECFNSVVTESCPPTTTCFNGECRALCFCDADCGEGACCSELLGDLGFRLCAPC